jgi:3-dehydroquinate dehydratase-2
MRIHIINGPNLNLLGRREPMIYGDIAFEEYFSKLEDRFPLIRLSYFQSNSEGRLIDDLQSHGFGQCDAIILNPAAYTHTSIALSDTVRAIETPVIEVHMTTLSEREDYRKINYLRPHIIAHFEGFGLESYAMALEFLISEFPK